MQIKNINLINFRNHEQLSLDNFKKINLIVGNNGVGKTSITEAINFSTIGRSFKTSDLNNLINFNSSNSNIEIEFNKSKMSKININLSDKNSYFYNDSEIKRNELYGKIISLIFEPTIFINFFHDKTFRRKFIDNEISKISPIHKFNLTTIKKIEKDKKEILRFKYNEKLINILNNKLSKLYFQISDARSKFSNEINTYYFNILKTFNIDCSSAEFNYESIFKNKNTDQINQILLNSNYEEKQNRKIINSINYDNFDIESNSKSIIKYGSQGQQRISFLTFIFSVAKIIENKTNYKPIIILDDVFSELDELNQENLIKKINEFGQFFITTTDQKINIKDAKIIKI